MSLAALIGIDKERYDQGNKFLSQDPYLQNFQARAPITFNMSSPVNTGIMGKYPYPYPPIIPQGDGGDGGGPIGPRDLGEITSDVGFGNLNDQTGMGYTLTEEDKAEIAAQKNKNRLTQAAQLGLFALNPVGYTLGKGIKGTYDFVKNRFFGGDGDGGSGGGGKGNKGKTTVDYYAPGGGYEGSDEQDRENEDTASTAGDAPGYSGPSPFEYGGRVGYSNGGLSKYEIFKLGELGYNTKGGTVLEPFGGIKVLRDILKVNKYADGGIVGLYI